MDAANLILLENSLLRYVFLKKINKKRQWIHEINRDRVIYGEFHHLFPELTIYPDKFRQYCRMSLEIFRYIENGVAPLLEKAATNWRLPINVEERLAVTLRFLATGPSYRSLAFSYRLGVSTGAGIVKETCEAIWQVFVAIHLPVPTEEILTRSASDYWEKFNLPHCVGSIDGKHVRIKCPSNSGTMFYNYKQYFSIVLQAIAGANYKFITIEVGVYGKQSDGGIFQSSQSCALLKNGQFNLPQTTSLPDSDIEFPFYIVGDEAYPLTNFLMRPFPRRQLSDENDNFNRRLSSARRCVECAFGILVANWRILTKAIETDPLVAEIIIKCVCLLQNIVIDREGNHDYDVNNHEQASGDIADQSTSRSNNRASRQAYELRDILKAYLLNH